MNRGRVGTRSSLAQLADADSLCGGTAESTAVAVLTAWHNAGRHNFPRLADAMAPSGLHDE